MKSIRKILALLLALAVACALAACQPAEVLPSETESSESSETSSVPESSSAPEESSEPESSEVSEESSAPELVEGGYANSKAAATEYVLENAGEELNASVVQPTGIIGPRDYGISNISRTIISYCRGRLPAGVKGGYDFVDVRDVAAGVISCAEKGRTGECYILSSEYMTIKQMLQTLQRVSDGKKVRMFIPSGLAKAVSPAVEKISLKLKKKPFFTPYSISVLGANGRFSHEKASKELGYSPRKLSRTLGDTYFWLKSIGYC